VSEFLKNMDDFVDFGTRSSFLFYCLVINHRLVISVIKSRSAGEAMDYVETYWPTLSQAADSVLWAALFTILVPLIMAFLSVAKLRTVVYLKSLEAATKNILSSAQQHALKNGETPEKSIAELNNAINILTKHCAKNSNLVTYSSAKIAKTTKILDAKNISAGLVIDHNEEIATTKDAILGCFSNKDVAEIINSRFY